MQMLPEDPVESEKSHTDKKVGDSVVFKPGNCVCTQWKVC